MTYPSLFLIIFHDNLSTSYLNCPTLNHPKDTTFFSYTQAFFKKVINNWTKKTHHAET
jgi:hypothetical protein